MNKKNNGKSTAKSVNNKQKGKSKKTSEQEAIFQEVTISLKNTEYNQKQNKKKKKKKKHKVIKIVLAIILVIILVLGGLFFKRWRENGLTFGGFVATILGHDANTLANMPRINILVIGQSQNLTDTILVCSYDPKAQDVSMLSIPRDTFVGRNKKLATASDKINALYQMNPELLVKAVNNITGLDIKYYVKVDTAGLRDLVDSVGGIYFDVPIDMDYDDPTQNLHIHLKQGYQLLDGDKAEQAVRFRHNNDGSTYPFEYGEQDLGRMKTQRAFITEVINQIAKPENFTKIDDYIRIANNNVETNFNLWNLKDYAPYAIDYKTENMRTETLPGAPEKLNGLWFYTYNKRETDALVNEMFKVELTAEQEKNSEIKISILNGTDDEMKLDNLKNLLKQNGYTVANTGTTTSTSKTAIINRTSQDEEVCDSLKELIGVGILSKSNSTKSGVDFTIIIGEDY